MALSRGFARARPAYYQHLQAADQPRANDLDGRGNLSDAALSRFCYFFLERCLDPIVYRPVGTSLPSRRGSCR